MHVYLSDKEKKRLEERALLLGMSNGGYLRYLLMGA